MLGLNKIDVKFLNDKFTEMSANIYLSPNKSLFDIKRSLISKIYKLILKNEFYKFDDNYPKFKVERNAKIHEKINNLLDEKFEGNTKLLCHHDFESIEYYFISYHDYTKNDLVDLSVLFQEDLEYLDRITI